MLSIRGLARPGLGPIDLDIADGECVALSGPSGAGKTLMLRAITDLDPCAGRVALNGTDRDAMPAPKWRRAVAYVAAEPAWWGDGVGEHFEDTAAAGDVLAALGLGAKVLDEPVARLSTGERQRLALARMLVLVPRVMLLDEPTSALDEDNRHRVEAVMRERFTAGIAALVVTHDPAQAARLGARRYALADGALRELGP